MSAVDSGITGLIGALGTASTGTAIGTLSGAAATTAKLYWIGSIIGLGTAAGSVVLGAAGISAVVAMGYVSKKLIFGSERKETDLEEYEKKLLLSAATLHVAVKKIGGKSFYKGRRNEIYSQKRLDPNEH